MTKPPELFGRVWSVTATDGAVSYTWTTLPIKFEAVKTLDLNPNRIKLTIYNMNPKSRKFIATPGVKLTIKAGYTALFGEVFKGNIDSVKDSRANGQYETFIEAKDGSTHKRNLFMSFAIKEGAPVKTVIEKILEKIIKEGTGKIQVKGLENATQGTKKTAAQRLADFDKETSKRTSASNKPPAKLTAAQRATRKQQKQQEVEKKRAALRQKLAQEAANEAAQANDGNFISVNVDRTKVLRGNCFDLLDRVCSDNNMQAVFLNGAIHIVPKDQPLTGIIPVLDKTSGLVGVPDKTETGWVFKTLMRSDIELGAVVKCKWEGNEGAFLVRRIDYDADSENQAWYQTLEVVPSSAI